MKQYAVNVAVSSSSSVNNRGRKSYALHAKINGRMRMKVDKIYQHFGKVNQLAKLCEEAEELSIEAEAFILSKQLNKDIKALLDECVDVQILLDQFKRNFFSKGEWTLAYQKKLDRTIERMTGGYYDNEK